MTDGAVPEPDLATAIGRALDAAAAATDAAHEAEAVLTARSDAARAMDLTARRSGWLLAAAGGASVLTLVLGGLVWLRSAADLRDAAEVHSAAAVAFVERLSEFNAALDKMDLMLAEAQLDNTSVKTSLDGLLTRMKQEPSPKAGTTPGDPEILDQLARLRDDLLAANAQTQLTILERLAAAPAPVIPSHKTQAPAAADKPAAKPKPRPDPAAATPNPFRYP